MDKNELVSLLEGIGVLMELGGGDEFKVKAYRGAAEVLSRYDGDMEEVVNGKRKLYGVGSGVLEKVREYWESGRIGLYEELRGGFREEFLELLEIRGMGPKRVKLVGEVLGVGSVEDLKKVGEDGRLKGVKGFGEKTVEGILKAIREREEARGKHLWVWAKEVSEGIVERLRGIKGVGRVEVVGEVRRKLEVVEKIEVLVEGECIEELVEGMDFLKITEEKGNEVWFELEGGFRGVVYMVAGEEYGYWMHELTGGEEYLKEVKEICGDIGRGFRNEQEYYRGLGMNWVEAELREGAWVVGEARRGELKRLVREEDIRGVFHVHTVDSDGLGTLEEMVGEVERRGWDYIGITDHSKSSFQANGLSPQRLLNQRGRIEAFNRDYKGRVRVFSGTECDILADGSLDYSDEILKELDFVIVSVHSGFTQEEEVMTKRIIRAIENRYVTMLGHPTGRLLLRRGGYGVAMEKVIDAAIANRVIIEINGNAQRLDMDWRYWRRAGERGLICAINPDAHSVEGLGDVYTGLQVARKGYLEKERVFNTWELREVEEYLRKKKGQ